MADSVAKYRVLVGVCDCAMLLPLIEKAREQSAHFGMLTGLVGATGGLGGFCLPFLLGAIKQQTGQYSGWLFFLLVLPCGAALVLLQLGTHGIYVGESNLRRIALESFRTKNFFGLWLQK